MNVLYTFVVDPERVILNGGWWGGVTAAGLWLNQAVDPGVFYSLNYRCEIDFIADF